MKKPKYTVDSPEVIKRCINPVGNATSIICPHCETPEVFCDEKDPDNQHKWFWAIKAFKVDDFSECRSCGEWF